MEMELRVQMLNPIHQRSLRRKCTIYLVWPVDGLRGMLAYPINQWVSFKELFKMLIVLKLKCIFYFSSYWVLAG